MTVDQKCDDTEAGMAQSERRIARPGLMMLLAAAVALPWTRWFAPVAFAAETNAAVPGSDIPPPQAEAAALKQEAVRIAQVLAEAYPNDALGYALLGSAYYNTGHSAEATKYLKKCLELRPAQADAYEILARVSYEKGDLEECGRLCREALARGSRNPEVLNQLGRALLDQGKADQAITVLEKAVALPEPLSQSHYLLGQAQLQAGNYPQAREQFQKAIALLPDHTQAYFGLYTAYLRSGQPEEAARARAQFQKLEAIDRRSLKDRSAQEDTLTGLPMVRQTVARTFFGAGQIYQAHEQATQATELFRKAASLDAENPIYRTSLETLFVRRKALAEGVEVFEKLATEQPNSRLNYLFLGRMRGRLDQIDAAAAAFRKVQQLAPQWAEGYRAQADLYLRTNRNPEEARTLAQRAAELAPTGPILYMVAVASLRCNDRPGARKALEQAVKLAPDEKRFQDMLQQLNQAP